MKKTLRWLLPIMVITLLVGILGFSLSAADAASETALSAADTASDAASDAALSAADVASDAASDAALSAAGAAEEAVFDPFEQAVSMEAMHTTASAFNRTFLFFIEIPPKCHHGYTRHFITIRNTCVC